MTSIAGREMVFPELCTGILLQYLIWFLHLWQILCI